MLGFKMLGHLVAELVGVSSRRVRGCSRCLVAVEEGGGTQQEVRILGRGLRPDAIDERCADWDTGGGQIRS